MLNLNKLALIIFIVLYSFANISFAQKVYNNENEKYSQVKIYATTDNDFKKIVNAGLYLEGGIHKKGLYFETWLSTDEISMLKASGVPYEITIPDWKTYYDNLPQMSSSDMQKAMEKSIKESNVSHSIYGSMGGYLKRQEVINKLDSMRIQYPTLISTKWSIGSTYESREIWCVRMTNGPDAPTGRPEVFLYSLTHAREPMGMECIMYYMYWLLENYNVDPIATFILNNREIYFIPIYNGDGYYYNETNNPTGGGTWRKNRKPCSGGYGTDLNRNYGIFSFWNSTNGGSSTSCSSDTYRGTSPNSEPETQAFTSFVNSRNFKSGLSIHTYGNDLLRPWAWCDPTPTVDSVTFNQWSSDMSQFNGYRTGTVYTVLGYYSRGDALDWMYNDSGHTKMIGMTPEVGSAFWPSSSEILTDVQAALWMCQYATLGAGAYVNNKSITFNKSIYSQNETGNVKVVFKNKGLSTASNVKIEFIPVNTSFITIPTQVYSKASLASLASDSVTFSFTVSSSCPNNYAIPTRIRFKQDDTSIVYNQIYYIQVGNGITMLADSAENGTSNWTFGTGWGLNTTYYYSSSHSFAYPNYANNANYSMTLSSPLNLSSYQAAFLEFYQRYSVESGYDYCYVEVSSDNGTNWTSLASYTGISSTWTKQSFNVTSYISSNFRLRYRLTSDEATTSTGWFVDNIKITSYQSPALKVENNSGLIPNKFALEQNYPNPFNPTTQINYSVAKDGLVKIAIYDILGREVKVLVNDMKKAGYYAVDFDGINLSSGMYFYRMECGSFVDTKKMSLIK
jgi:carboxypeptidase T